MWSSSPDWAPASSLALLCAGRVVLIAVLLAGCGFHLRGEAHYEFDTLYLNSPAAQPLTADLRRSLAGIGTAQLVASADKAQVILDIASVENNKQILSLSSGGKVSEERAEGWFLRVACERRRRVSEGIQVRPGRRWVGTGT